MRMAVPSEPVAPGPVLLIHRSSRFGEIDRGPSGGERFDPAVSIESDWFWDDDRAWPWSLPGFPTPTTRTAPSKDLRRRPPPSWPPVATRW